MKYLVLAAIAVGMSAGTAHASTVTLSLHTTGDTPIIDLSTILNQWGTPSDSSSVFTILGTGTDKIGGLNIVNDLGINITSLAVYAYGTVGSTSYTGSCSNDSGSPFSSCTGSGVQAKNTTISVGAPISWDYSGGGSIAANEEFRLVDTSTGTGTNFFYEIEVNGQGPSNPASVPEPSSALSLGGGLLALGLLQGIRQWRLRHS